MEAVVKRKRLQFGILRYIEFAPTYLIHTTVNLPQRDHLFLIATTHCGCLREHPFSTYARGGGGGVGQKRTQYYEFISDSDVILHTRGGEGVKKGRNFAYVLNGWSLM